MAQELSVRLNPEDKRPLYRQIYEYIRGEIRSGALEPGERIPSTRAMSADLHIARSTAELAYSQLLSEGYIHSKKNSGYYVSEVENLAELHFEDEDPFYSFREKENAAGWEKGSEKKKDQSVSVLSHLGKQSYLNSSLIDFSLRHTEMSAFPYSTWKKIMREVMVDANSEMFSHSEPGGDLSLRTTIARYLHFSRGVRCTPEQVIVGAGNDYLLILLRHILGEGRKVAMENPSYLRAAQIFSSFGYRICPVRMDDDGMLPASVAQTDADLVMEAADRYIIEDDYDSEFRYRGKPIPALQSLDRAGRVIYIGTFSKAIAPAIRISYMILPQDLVGRYREKCWFFSSTVSRIDQRILNDFMKNGHFERHLNRMRSIYRARHDELLAQLRPLQDRYRILGAGTGLHLGLEALAETAEDMAKSMTDTRDGQSVTGKSFIQIEHELVQRAAARGVAVYALSDYLLPGSGQHFTGRRRPTILLGFGALDETSIREGVGRLAEALLSV